MERIHNDQFRLGDLEKIRVTGIKQITMPEIERVKRIAVRTPRGHCGPTQAAQGCAPGRAEPLSMLGIGPLAADPGCRADVGSVTGIR
jgi:hypothetical protein